MPLSVVLAGGGTAGHVEPALALADAAAPPRPDDRHHRARHRHRPRGAAGAGPRLRARRDPAGAAAAPARPLDLLRVPGRLAGAVRQTARPPRPGRRPTSSSASAATSRCPPTSPPAAAARRSSSTRPTPGPGWPTGSAPGSRRTSPPPSRAAGCAARQVLGIPLRAADRRRSTAPPPAPRRAPPFGLRRRAGAAGHRRLAGRPAASTRAVTGAAADLAAAGVQVLHVAGPKQADAVRAAVRRPPPTHHVLPYVDRMDLAYAAADLAVCRAGAMTCAELAAVGLPAVYVPLPIGNGEQALNARPVVDAGGGLLVDDADLRRRLRPRARCCRCCATPARLAAMGARRRRARPPRRRRRRWPTWSLRGRRSRPMTDADLGRGAPRRHRRRRHERHRPGAAGPRRRRVRQRRQGLAAPSPRCARSAPRSTSATPPRTSTAPTPSSSPRAIRAGQPRAASRPASAACACCCAPRRWPRSWPAAAASPSPARTARPRPPRCSPSRPSTAASTRRSPSAATSTRPAATPTTAAASCSSSRPTRATARSSPTARTPRSSPTSRPTTSTTTATPPPSTAAFEDFVRPIDPDGFLVACADDPGARRLGRGRPRPRASTCAPTAPPTDADLRLDDLTVSGTTSRYEPVLRGRRLPAGARSPSRAGTSRSTPARRCSPGIGLGLPEAQLVEGLAGFTGVRRRMELKGIVGGVRVYDDYAHHPTELRRAAAPPPARSPAAGRLVVAFQPHRYSRTLAFADGVRRGARRWPTRSSSWRSTPPARTRCPARPARPSPPPCRCRAERVRLRAVLVGGARRAGRAAPGPATSSSPSAPATSR